VAGAVALLAVATMSGWTGSGGATTGAVGMAPPAGKGAVSPVAPNQVRVATTVATTVVCDEGLPPYVCWVPGPVFEQAPVPVEAWTYDGTAMAGEDYHPFAGPVPPVPGAVEVAVWLDIVPDPLCEPVEEFLVLFAGPEIQMLTPVTIVDDDC